MFPNIGSVSWYSEKQVEDKFDERWHRAHILHCCRGQSMYYHWWRVAFRDSYCIAIPQHHQRNMRCKQCNTFSVYVVNLTFGIFSMILSPWENVCVITQICRQYLFVYLLEFQVLATSKFISEWVSVIITVCFSHFWPEITFIHDSSCIWWRQLAYITY